MKVFGEKWDAPIEEGLERVPTPVGLPCLYCEEPIADGDKGVLMPFSDADGEKEVAQHRECLIRTIFGSVGHLHMRCSCFGGTEEDPPGLTKREAAKASLEIVMSRSKPAKA